MAFRRRPIKKASYYVWFLGAKESKGLRGEEYVLPVLQNLTECERELEPSKVTLQVSNKGLKIVQNVPKKSSKSQAVPLSSCPLPVNKMEQIKHLIPHHAVTCVVQEEDIVCCILLIYNPVTKCPVHVHGYRCDSVETATALAAQLQTLIDRPDNQKKFREIESRLALNGLNGRASAQRMMSTCSVPSSSASQGRSNSDGRSTRTDGSDGTDDSFDSFTERSLRHDSHRRRESCEQPEQNSRESLGENSQKVMTSATYDSLAHELKVKLGNAKKGPILLPPRDYDTISRARGNLDGIELRKSTNTSIVGIVSAATKNKRAGLVAGSVDKTRLGSRSESSGTSSGIGSEEALPVIKESGVHRTRSHPHLRGSTISDEEEEEDDDSAEDGAWAPPQPVHQRSHHQHQHQRLREQVCSHGDSSQLSRSHRGQEQVVPPSIGPSIVARSASTVSKKLSEPPRFYFPAPSTPLSSSVVVHPCPPSSVHHERSPRRQESNPDFARRSRPIVSEATAARYSSTAAATAAATATSPEPYSRSQVGSSRGSSKLAGHYHHHPGSATAAVALRR